MKRIISFLLCLALVFSFVGCAKRSEKAVGKLNVVTTVFPLYDFVRAVGGDRVDITLIIPPGSEIHSFEPTPSDMAAVYESDVFFYIGGESDTWVQRLLDDKKINSCALIDFVNLLYEDGEDEYDEHIWTSGDNAVLMVEKIAKELSKADNSGKEVYRKNCENYCKRIKSVTDRLKKAVKESGRKFILVADRFPFKYMADCCGFSYEAAFGGCAVSTDISLKVMARLVDTVKEKNIKYVYCTEMSNKNIALALKEYTGAEILELHSAHNVTADDFKNKITYVDIMERNLKSLKRGL